MPLKALAFLTFQVSFAFLTVPAEGGLISDAPFQRTWERRFVFDNELDLPSDAFVPAARYSADAVASGAEMRFVSGGRIVAAFQAPEGCQPPFRMHLVVTGVHRPCVYVSTNGTTSLAYVGDWPEGFDPRRKENLTRVKFSVSDSMRKPRVSLSAGVGQADTRFVSRGVCNEPYVEDGRLYFTFSARSFGSYLGVMSFDPSARDFRLEGVILFDYGDGLLRNDLAADLFWDESSGSWRAYVSNFSTADSCGGTSKFLSGRAPGGINVAWTEKCPLHGLSVMRARNLGLDGMNEDPDGVRNPKTGKWLLLVSRFTPRGIRAALLESDRWDGPFSPTGGPVSEDSTGTTLVFSEDGLYALSGSSEREFFVYECPRLKRMGRMNVLNPPWDGQVNARVWPAYARLPSGRELLLTFDRENFPGMPTPNWTYGKLLLYER